MLPAPPAAPLGLGKRREYGSHGVRVWVPVPVGAAVRPSRAVRWRPLAAGKKKAPSGINSVEHTLDHLKHTQTALRHAVQA